MGKIIKGVSRPKTKLVGKGFTAEQIQQFIFECFDTIIGWKNKICIKPEKIGPGFRFKELKGAGARFTVTITPLTTRAARRWCQGGYLKSTRFSCFPELKWK